MTVSNRTEPQPSFEYRPALDGVRAVAVVAVLLYHGGLSRARGGYLGVDVFFVISGYLISSLLLHEHTRTGTIALGAFWARRARRLLPALFAVLLFVAAYAAFAAAPDELARIRGDALATLGYVANWRFIASGSSYFDQFVTPSPLRHAWSLAIEEQWYVVWPPVLLFLLRRGRNGSRRVAVVVSALACVASAGLMFVLFDPKADPSRVYYGTDTRAQGLLVGALLAFLLDALPRDTFTKSGARRRAVDVAGVAGAALLGYAFVTVRDTSHAMYRGGFLAIAVCSAALVAASVQPVGIVRRVLAWTPFVAVGRISYGLYLWHWPVYVWLSAERTGWHGYALLGLRLAVTTAVSIASFFLVERPVRLRAGPFRSVRRGFERGLVPAAVVVTVVAVVAGTTGASTGPTQLELQAAAHAKELAAKPYVPDSQIDKVPRVLVAGDSVAWTFTTKGPIEVRYFGIKLGFGVRWASESKIGCGVARGAVVLDGLARVDENLCSDWPQRYEKQVAQFDPDLAVVMVGAWEVFDHRVHGTVLEVGTPAYARYLRSELRAVVRVLHRRGARIVFTSVPCYAPLADTVGARQRVDPARIAFVNAAIDDVARLPYVDVLDIGHFLCPGGKPRATIDGITVRSDGVHFSKGGSSLMWDWLGPEMAKRAFAAQRERRAP